MLTFKNVRGDKDDDRCGHILEDAVLENRTVAENCDHTNASRDLAPQHHHSVNTYLQCLMSVLGLHKKRRYKSH